MKVFLAYVCACVCVCVCVCEAVRFVCIFSLFVHIWLETQEQPVFSLPRDGCAGDHTENNCGDFDFRSWLRSSPETTLE